MLKTKINQLLVRWDKLKFQPIPTEISSKFNYKNLNQILQAVWTDPPYRTFTPMIKNFIDKGLRILIDSPITKAEKGYMETIFNITYRNTKKIELDYNKVEPHEYGIVDAGRNFNSIGAKTTPGLTGRRGNNLQKYLEPDDTAFSPDGDILEAAVNLYITILKESIPEGKLSVDLSIENLERIRIARSKYSNVGYPYFSNEKKVDEKQLSFRSVVAKDLHRGIKKYGIGGLTSLPAMIISRDQNKGNTIDLNQSAEHILSDIRNGKGKYEDSKARVVGAFPLLSNYIATATIDKLYSYGHETNRLPPHLCALTSRDNRRPIMEKFQQGLTKENYVAGNFDISGFDLSVNAVGKTIAGIVRSEMTDGLGAIGDSKLADMLEMLMVQGLYTKAYAYDPYKKEIVEVRKSKAIASGEGYTNFDGSTINAVNTLYSLMKLYGISGVEEKVNYCRENGFSLFYTVGDDLLVMLKHGDDFDKFTAIAKQNGFDMTDKHKLAKGVFFIQERGMGNKAIYPLTRVSESMFFTETSKGYGGAVGDMSYLNTIYNAFDNDRLMLKDYINLGMALDKTCLGLLDESGVKITPTQLAKISAQQQEQFGETVKTVVGNGDPSKENLYNDKGNVITGVVKDYFSLLKDVYDDSNLKLQRRQIQLTTKNIKEGKNVLN